MSFFYLNNAIRVETLCKASYAAYGDNQAALHIAKKPMVHARTTAIAADFFCFLER